MFELCTIYVTFLDLVCLVYNLCCRNDKLRVGERVKIEKSAVASTALDGLQHVGRLLLGGHFDESEAFRFVQLG
eukprot:m.25895 g.25895  ORF g.25895 m.25895 type:complete len:74 (+) comp8777_c0_seq1:91-312(+)